MRIFIMHCGIPPSFLLKNGAQKSLCTPSKNVAFYGALPFFFLSVNKNDGTPGQLT